MMARSCRRMALCAAGLLLVAAAAALAAGPDRNARPNYRQAMLYNSQYLRQFVYDTRVTPHWIGKTDTFWYSYRTSAGTRYWKVNARLATKEPLFDRVRLGGLLSEMLHKPLDPDQLTLSRESVNDEGTQLKFVVEDFQYAYDLAAESLTKLGKAPPAPPRARPRTREEFERLREEFQQRRNQQQQQQDQQRQQEDQRQEVDQEQQRQEQNQQEEQQRDDQQQNQRDDGQRGQQQRRGGRRGGAFGGRGGGDYRNFSPDRSMYVFARKHNLFLVELKPAADAKAAPEKSDPAKPDAEQDSKGQTGKQDVDGKAGGSVPSLPDQTAQDQTKTGGTQGDQGRQESQDQQKQKEKTGQTDQQKVDQNQVHKDKEEVQQEKRTKQKQQQTKKQEQQKQHEKQQQQPAPAEEKPQIAKKSPPDRDAGAIQLTTDGVDKYSFGGTDEDRKVRPNVRWSSDSKSFYVTRSDTRDVKELWVINSLAEPRPTLEKYPYPMPGEEGIRRAELYTFQRDTRKLTRVTPRWKDENYSNMHFGKTGDELRFIRRDRLLRHIEFCSLVIPSSDVKCLIDEGFENANVLTTQYRYLDNTNEMIWWSERTGWAHFYLYDRDGTFKNAITTGPYHVNRIVDVDEKKRLLYFTANGHEPKENIYYEHLYVVHLDGTGLTLLDPGNATHRSTLSPSRQFVVDNYSRIDMTPKSVLRDATGKELLVLEEADLSRLYEVGWKMPETFTVKAADGVTDLYGNLWKPFDFDPQRKYPIIVNVYPGPQTEGVTHSFSAASGTMQLAQLGFIVIQVGHRGGTPNRSKAYGSYGYFNLRDYGLADKKTAIEQLAARCPFIDLDRVGIYGHSGGGFMTAAALLQKPYNNFFKVGVATSGNHDNNIYNNSWSERYHGLKEVPVDETQTAAANGSARGQNGQGPGQQGGRRANQGASDDEEESYWEYFQTDEADAFPEDAAREYMRALIDPEWTPPPEMAGQWGRSSDSQPAELDLQDDKDNKQRNDDGQKSGESEKQSDSKRHDSNAKSNDSISQTQKTQTQNTETNKDSEAKKQTRFDIHVPTNQELAENLTGHLLLVHGEIDNNVHPANTLRLVKALIKANKRFDMLILPGKRHGYGDFQPYVTQRMWEYFATYLLEDHQTAADIYSKNE